MNNQLGIMDTIKVTFNAVANIAVKVSSALSKTAEMAEEVAEGGLVLAQANTNEIKIKSRVNTKLEVISINQQLLEKAKEMGLSKEELDNMFQDAEV